MPEESRHRNPGRNYHLRPGEVFVTGESVVISTVLGSCVAVCLWDEKRRIGGMNHIVFPACRQGEALSTRFANVGTFVLYDLMKEEGAVRRLLNARVFGGASGIASFRHIAGLAVGHRNIEVVQAVLNKLDIPVVGKDIGGHTGRKIFFDVRTGKIRMSRLNSYDFVSEKTDVMKTDVMKIET
ncbi:MAG: chemotaxis protein CheD [Proteobacteria bacterium]|nr:chemotaxis protein CheD [Pseudomonadota bacterium]